MTPETEDRLLEKVGSIDAKVEILLQHAKTHDRRLGAVEKRMWFQQGAIGVAAAVIVPKLRAIVGI